MASPPPPALKCGASDEPQVTQIFPSIARSASHWHGSDAPRTTPPSADGGVARHYCLITGWGASYPETTGYIVPTIIREGQAAGNTELLERARKMLDWLVSIQMPGGGFQRWRNQ